MDLTFRAWNYATFTKIIKALQHCARARGLDFVQYGRFNRYRYFHVLANGNIVEMREYLFFQTPNDPIGEAEALRRILASDYYLESLKMPINE